MSAYYGQPARSRTSLECPAGLARRSWFRRGLSQQSVRRNAIADDADSAVPLALDKGLPFGIGDKVGATVTNRARSDSLAHEVGISWAVAIARPAIRGWTVSTSCIAWRRAVSWRSGIGWRSRSVLCIRRLHPNGRSHDGHASDSDQSALHDLPPFEEQHAEKCW